MAKHKICQVMLLHPQVPYVPKYCIVNTCAVAHRPETRDHNNLEDFIYLSTYQSSDINNRSLLNFFQQTFLSPPNTGEFLPSMLAIQYILQSGNCCQYNKSTSKVTTLAVTTELRTSIWELSVKSAFTAWYNWVLM